MFETLIFDRGACESFVRKIIQRKIINFFRKKTKTTKIQKYIFLLKHNNF